MKKTTIALSGLGLILLLTGVFGLISESNSNANTVINQDYNSSTQMNGWNDDTYVGMMGNQDNRFGNEDYSNSEKKTNEELEAQVENYISKSDEELEIADVFIFSDTDYYYSIVEKATGKGAMELLVNPYTGYVYPEYGPNMMWNLKYGMMGRQGGMGYGGMMGSQGGMGYQSGRGYGGMMGNQRAMDYDEETGNQNWIGYDNVDENELSLDQAMEQANEFLSKQSTDYKVAESYHEFYGYFTFHVEYKGQANGMLSVNAFTGDVWFHDWHGELIEVAGNHDDEN